MNAPHHGPPRRHRAFAWRRRLGVVAALCAAAALATPASAAPLAPPIPSGHGGGPQVVAAARPVLVLPLPGARIVSLARLPDAPWRPGHRGIDVAAAPGASVVAPADGVVAFAGTVVDRPVVTVRHAGGLVTSLEPVEASVSVGDAVRAGDPIGTVGAEPGHCAPSACVHWGLRLDGAYVDPLDYLAGWGEVVLLPRP